MRFAIVTPAFNVARYIDEAILSVVSQSGPFIIRYHVQDGGSTDATREKLARWQERLNGTFPILCDGVEFTYDSAPDAGMYDAISRGFDKCGDADAMSWINADDRYELGAFAAVGQIMQAFADVEWLSGRVAGIDASGAMTDAAAAFAFPRAAIAAGIFDARHAERFIQQAGIFWRSHLWHAVGGVDTRFRLAGDFDLWRRFASRTDMVTVDAIFGCHRRRDGQITSALDRYYAEVDASLSATETAARAAMTERYWKAVRAERCLDDALRYRVMHLLPDGWVCDSGYVPLHSPEIAAIYHSTSWRLTAPLRRLANRLILRTLPGAGHDASRTG